MGDRGSAPRRFASDDSWVRRQPPTHGATKSPRRCPARTSKNRSLMPGPSRSSCQPCWMALARRTSTSRGSSGRTSSQRGSRRTLTFSMRIRFIGSPGLRGSDGASRSLLGRGSSPFRGGCLGARPPVSTTVARGRRVRRPIAGRAGAGPSRSARAASGRGAPRTTQDWARPKRPSANDRTTGSWLPACVDGAGRSRGCERSAGSRRPGTLVEDRRTSPLRQTLRKVSCTRSSASVLFPSRTRPRP